MRVRPADVAIERQPELVGPGLGHREGDAEDRVRSEAGLVLGAVEVDERRVDAALVERLELEDRVADLAVDVPDRGLDALAAEASTAVAQLDRLVLAGRRP